MKTATWVIGLAGGLAVAMLRRDAVARALTRSTGTWVGRPNWDIRQGRVR